MNFLLVFLASVCGAIGSLLLRKNNDFGGSASGYLLFYFIVSFFFVWKVGEASFFSIFMSPMSFVGAMSGFSLSLLMWSIMKALNHGPSGLTFAFQNSGALFSPLFLVLIFGPSFGFALKISSIFGLVLILIGLFLAAGGERERKLTSFWFVFAIVAFFTQTLTMFFMLWSGLFSIGGLPRHPLIFFHCGDCEKKLFLPAMFLAASFVQLIVFCFQNKGFKPVFKWEEAFFGSLGGILNCLSMIMLLGAADLSNAIQKSMLFPVFVVGVISLTYVWSKLLYKETVRYFALLVLVAGAIISLFF